MATRMSQRPIPQSRRYSVSPDTKSSNTALKAATILSLALILFVGLGVLLVDRPFTIAGVPLPIIIDFLGDETARNAYFQRDRRLLHDRLQAMGVEEQIKAFYRPQIRDEVKLDQYIHQLLYDRTGYVGNAYRVNSQGSLVLKEQVPEGFDEWFKLAREAGLVIDKVQRDGVQYVISADGILVPYKQLVEVFSQEELRSLVEIKRH